jgi:hypothetical protein
MCACSDSNPVWCVKINIYRLELTIPGYFGRHGVHGCIIPCQVLINRGSSSQGTVSTLSTQSTPHPRARIIPAGRAPCELGWKLRDQAPAKHGGMRPQPQQPSPSKIKKSSRPGHIFSPCRVRHDGTPCPAAYQVSLKAALSDRPCAPRSPSSAF